MSSRIATLLVNYRNYFLFVSVVLFFISFPASHQLKLQWNLESMFADEHPLVASYQLLKDRFGGNQIVLVVYEDPQAWEDSGVGLDRLSVASKRLSQVGEIAAVLSLSELDEILSKLANPANIFQLNASRKSSLLNEDNRLARALLKTFAGYTHSEDGNTFAIACVLAPTQNGSTEQSQVVEELRETVRSLPSPLNAALVTGEPVLLTDGFEIVATDGWRLQLTSTVIVIAVLLIAFRSIRWTLIPIVIVQFSIILTKALLMLLGLELTMISSTLSAVVTVIGVATSMHVLLLYQSKRRERVEREDAIQSTFAELLPAISWAIVTDAIGFSALLFATVGPVQDFGLMMTVACGAVLAAIVLLIPGLALFGSWSPDPKMSTLDLVLRHRLRQVLRAVTDRRALGRSILLFLTVAALLGCLQVRIETDFTKNFGPETEIVRGYEIVEEQMGGAGVWDIMLPAPERLTSNYLDEVSNFQRRLRSLVVNSDDSNSLELSKVLSIVDADEASRESSLAAMLPADTRIRGFAAALPTFSRAMICYDAAKDGNWLRIMLRSRERVDAELKQELVAKVEGALLDFEQQPGFRETLTADSGSPDNRRGAIAGYHVMLCELVGSVLSDQWKCFLIAATGIMLAVSIAARSIHLAAIATITNALPILLIIGTMGWLGIRVNMGAAMISAVSLGLSVDSSIHYLLHFRRKSKHVAAHKALSSAQENVGLAATLATIALVSGFLSMSTSQFVPTVVFGTLTSLSMLGGLVGNLIVLPLLFPRSGLGLSAGPTRGR